MTTLQTISFGRTITLEWWIERSNRPGFDPRSTYVERFWLPVLGPSSTWLLRYLAGRLDPARQRLEIDLAETANALGLGDRTGRHAPFMRTLARTIDFRMARVTESGDLAIRRYLPELSPRHLARLSDSLRQAHFSYLHDRKIAELTNPLESHGRQLALSLLALDESADDTERQLMQWRFPPSLARSCVRFATVEHARRAEQQIAEEKAS